MRGQRQGIYFFLFIIFFLTLPLSNPAVAAKKRVFTTKNTTPVSRGGVYSRARLSRPTHSVVITFLNMNTVKKITYELSYSANGMEEGAMGTITPSGQSTDTRDLYFGTCSKGVCTPHGNILDATLVITTGLTSGGTNIKRYRIKI